MKNFNQLLLLVLLLMAVLKPAYSQNSFYVGKLKEVAATYKLKANAAIKKSSGQEVQVSHMLPGKTPLVLKLKSTKQEGNANLFFGEVNNIKNSNFYLKIAGREASGFIILKEQKKYYRYSSSADGSVFLTEEDINKVLCIGLSEKSEKTSGTGQTSPTTIIATATPVLESLPGAEAVLYLDFDGQTVTGTLWNGFTNGDPIEAAPANLTETEKVQVWKMMSEDYRPFDLNVTTNEAVFNSAPANKRMRVIFTPTSYFYPNAGGVAYIGSFTFGGTSSGEQPCWVFNSTSKYAGEAGSHEAGHTFNLKHDGRTVPEEDYFSGQNFWAPIMGTGYYVPVVQWSKGEYPNANRQEDDLEIIATNNGFGYRPDDHGNGNDGVTSLIVDGAGNVSATANTGIISTQADGDVFSFTTGGGPVILNVNPDPDYPNLDILLSLRDSENTIVASANPSTLEASLNLNLAAGTYFLTIDGAKGDFGADSDYGSLGAYSVSGTIPTTVTAQASGTLTCNVLSVGLTGISSIKGSGVTYAWNGPMGSTITGAETLTPTVNMPGEYTLTVTGTDGSAKTAWVTVMQEPCSVANCTLTQGFYGNKGGKYCDGRNSSQLMSYLLSKYGVGGMVIGKPGVNSLTIKSSDVACLIASLPSGGPNIAISGNGTFQAGACATTNDIPVNEQGRFKNSLLGQTITLGLNLIMDNSTLGSLLIKEKYMVTGKATNCGTAGATLITGTEKTFTFPTGAVGKTVAELYAMANEGLGGGYPGMSLSDLNKTLKAINEGFDKCRILSSFSGTPVVSSVNTSVKSQNTDDLLTTLADTKLDAYPNPYTDKATIAFSLKEGGDYTLVLHDVKGSVVNRISAGKAEAGKVYSFEIGNNKMPEGIYIARLSTDKFNKVLRISLRR